MTLCNRLNWSSWKLSIPHASLKTTRSTGCWNAGFQNNHNRNQHQYLLHSSRTQVESPSVSLLPEMIPRSHSAQETEMRAKLKDLFIWWCHDMCTNLFHKVESEVLRCLWCLWNYQGGKWWWVHGKGKDKFMNESIIKFPFWKLNLKFNNIISKMNAFLFLKSILIV